MRPEHELGVRPRRRIARKLFKAFGIFLLTLLGLIVAAALCVNLSPGRAFVAKQANSILAKQFLGKVEVTSIGAIGLRGASNVDARVYDPAGKLVLDMRGASVALRLPKLVWDMVVAKPDPTVIVIDRIELRHADVTLRDDGSGKPTLAKTFTSRTPGPPSTKKTFVLLNDVSLQHAWVHGALGSAPPLDVELSQLRASARIEDATRAKLEHVRVKARGLPKAADPDGELQGSVRIGKAENDRDGRVTFKGRVASIPVSADASIAGKQLAAEVRGLADAAAVTALVPSVTPRGPIELVAKVSGALPKLSFEANLRSIAGRLEARGDAELGPPLAARVRLVASELDASGFVASAPATHVGVSVSAHATLTQGAIEGHYEISLERSSVDGQAIPALLTSGGVARTAEGQLRVAGSADIKEPGAPTRVDYELELGQRSTLDATTETWLTRPKRLVDVAQVSAAGVIRARVHYDLDKKAVDGRVEAALPRIVQKENAAAHVRLLATVKGNADDPTLTVDARTEELVLPQRTFKRVRIRANGTLAQARVEAELVGARRELIRAETLVKSKPEPTLYATELLVKRERTTLHARVKELAFGARVRVDGLELEGVGRAQASLTVDQHGLQALDASTDELDLPRLAWVLGIEPPLDGGTATLKASVKRERGKLHGHVRGQGQNIALGKIRDGTASLDITLDRGTVSGAVQANLRQGGSGRVSLEDVPVLEPPYTAAKLERLTGKVTVRGDLDLQALSPLFAGENSPVEHASGKVELDVSLERTESGEQLPELIARVETTGLELVGKRDSEAPIESDQQARSTAPWSLKELDLQAELELEQSGATAVSVRAFDRKGDLATLNAKTHLPKTISGAMRPAVSDLPLEAKLSVPPRSFEQLPALVPLRGTEGSGTLELTVEGTPRDPRVRLAGRLTGLRPINAKTVPLDVDFKGLLARAGGELTVNASAQGRRVGHVQSSWLGDATKLAQTDLAHSPVRGRALVELDGLPLAAVPGTLSRNIAGSLSGRLSVEDFGQDARVNGRLEAKPLTIGQGRFEHVLATVTMQGSELLAKAELKQKDGDARAELQAAYQWGARVAPKLEVPLETRVVARQFRLAGLTPLMPGTLNELDGRLDANVSGQFGGAEPYLEGQIHLSEGVVQEPTVGQRFSEIDARVRLQRGEVRLERMSARGTAGRLTATGSARLHGLSLQDADAQLRITEKDKIPVTVEGVALGDAYGRVQATIRAGDEQRATLVKIEIPELTVELPETEKKGVQNLEPAEFVRVGVHQRAGDFATLPLQPLKDSESKPATAGPATVIIVTLGDKVFVKRGTMVDVRLTGEARIESGAESAITGQIRLQGGKLDLRGKLFEIERGVITFDGQEPSNPMIIATARWDSPADYSVFAEYTGTAKQGNLRLYSEPSLTQDQILSLIMFGNPDGALGGGSGDPSAAAFGVAGGTAVRGLNRVLSRVTQLDIDARVDTSTGTARPELVMQLTPRLSARLTRALGEPAPGEAPDRTFATLDLRLTGRWSLATQVGDRGASALDLIWRHRY